MRRRLTLGFGLLCCLGLVGVWLLRPAAPVHRINRASFEQIQGGMREAEVEALFGTPAGDYTGGAFAPADCGVGLTTIWHGPKDQVAAWEVWSADEGEILVGFDQERRVAAKLFVPMFRGSFTRRWLSWLGL
jgi:hypothetical protein